MKIKSLIIIITLIYGVALILSRGKVEKSPTAQNANSFLSKRSARITPLPTHWSNGRFRFIAHEDSPTVWRTDLYVKDEKQPTLTLIGYYGGSKFQTIDNGREQYLEILLLSGKLVNSQLFRFSGDQLDKVPVYDIDSQQPKEVWASADPEYKDVNNDGIKEMFIYHRHYPPDYSRSIEQYAFRGNAFIKQKEYIEKTNNLVL